MCNYLISQSFKFADLVNKYKNPISDGKKLSEFIDMRQLYVLNVFVHGFCCVVYTLALPACKWLFVVKDVVLIYYLSVHFSLNFKSFNDT